MHTTSLLITGATLVNDSSMVVSDILVRDGKIHAIGNFDELKDSVDEVIDARGRLVLPGCVDVHTHMDLQAGPTRSCDDWFTGTRGALCGGTTTVVDHMAFGPKGCSLMSRVDEYHGLADGVSACDYRFHGVVSEVNDNIVEELPQLLKAGINSAKMYMTYPDRLTDDEAIKLLTACRELNIMVCVHCENHDLVEYTKNKLADQGCLTARYHGVSRPIQAEAEAVDRILRLASAAGDAPIYIVHLTTKDGLDVIKAARKRGQKNIFVETCTQYLALTEDAYERDDALKFTMSPPLRRLEDVEALWQGVAAGDIDNIATDHCPFTYGEQKQKGAHDFRKAPGGAPGVEERFMVVATEGVARGRIDWPTLVRTCMTNPAKSFGLYPQKGALLPGSDADIIIIDPQRPHTISIDNLHGACDYSCYEGYESRCTIERVLLRGKTVVSDNSYVGSSGDGRYVPADGPSPLID